MRLTWPEIKPIKSVGVEVITHSVASPTLPSTGVRGKSIGVGPAHPQVSGLCCDEGLHLIHNQLVVPLPVLSRPVTDSQEGIGPHAVDT